MRMVRWNQSKDVFGIRVEMLGDLADGIAAIREKGHLMVCLHALGLEQVEETALGLLIVALHQSKTFTRRRCLFGVVATEREDASAGDDLEQVGRLLFEFTSTGAYGRARYRRPDLQRAAHQGSAGDPYRPGSLPEK